MSTDFDAPVSTLLFGFYSDSFVGVGQIGSLTAVLKLSMEGFKMVEPKAPHQTPLTMTRQGNIDDGDGTKASDANLPVSDAVTNPVFSNKATGVRQQINVDSHNDTSDQQMIPLVKGNQPTTFVDSHLRDRPDSIMSMELCKVYERVYNQDITDWHESLLDIYSLISEHQIFATWLMMMRFFHGAFRFKVRVLSDNTSDQRAIRVGFRGMYGAPGATSLTFLQDTLGHNDGTYWSNRGAFSELCVNQVGEILDFEIPFTWMGDTLTLAPFHNITQTPGYDFGSLYIASNKILSAGTITIDVAASDDCTFSCFVWLPKATRISAYPNSFVEIPPEEDSDIEVVQVVPKKDQAKKGKK
jgi:hypothetical protein